jgi:NAD-dependent SIR2 family protein deacetylase
MSNNVSDRNVFILGAGFSRDAGAPLIHDFLDRARGFYDDPEGGLDTHERAQFAEVFRFKREVAKAREKFRIDLDNIEELFGLVEMSQRLGSTSAETRDAMVYLIAKTLQLAISNPAQRSQVRVGLNRGYAWDFIKYLRRDPSGTDIFETDIYTHFALLIAGKYDDSRKVSTRSSTVITFNYDLVLDDALARVGTIPDYGLNNAFDETPRGDASVALLKLHGSTNWSICNGCNQIHVLEEKVTSNPILFRSKVCRSCSKAGLRLLLVPPSWDKSEYSQVMQPVWKKAVEALRDATRICVMGYSMPETDAFFKFLLTLGLAENDQLYKFILVDLVSPSSAGAVAQQPRKRKLDPIDVRYKEMLEDVFVERRFEFHPEGVANFVITSARHVLRRGEQIF